MNDIVKEKHSKSTYPGDAEPVAQIKTQHHAFSQHDDKVPK